MEWKSLETLVVTFWLTGSDVSWERLENSTVPVSLTLLMKGHHLWWVTALSQGKGLRLERILSCLRVLLLLGVCTFELSQPHNLRRIAPELRKHRETKEQRMWPRTLRGPLCVCATRTHGFVMSGPSCFRGKWVQFLIENWCCGVVTGMGGVVRLDSVCNELVWSHICDFAETLSRSRKNWGRHVHWVTSSKRYTWQIAALATRAPVMRLILSRALSALGAQFSMRHSSDVCPLMYRENV